jgi:hypothetical protein
VSNGQTYLIVWYQQSGYFIRRLSGSGEWLDAEPELLMGLRFPAFASNGTDVMALSGAYSNTTYVLQTRRIAMSGPLVVSSPVEVQARASSYSLIAPAIASNGTGYLVSWEETTPYDFPYCCFPMSLFVQRLRADGTPLDATPRTLRTSTAGSLQGAQIAASDGIYFVAFRDGVRFHGTRVTSDGRVLDLDMSGAPLVLSDNPNWGTVVTAPHGFMFVRMTLSQNFAVFLDAATLAANEAKPVLSPATPIPGSDLIRQIFPSAALRGGVIALAYQRLAAEAGDVRRVFLRLYTLGHERRPAAGR